MNQPSLFDPPAVAKTRRTDPDTSRRAALSQYPVGCELDILLSLDGHGAQCGEHLARRWTWRNDGTVKTALSRVVKRGWAEYDGECWPNGDERPAHGVAHITHAGKRAAGLLRTQNVIASL